MIIWKITEEGVRYYQATSGGRAVFASKSSAPELDGTALDTVLRHLKLMEPNARIGAINRSEKFDERKASLAAKAI